MTVFWPPRNHKQPRTAHRYRETWPFGHRRLNTPGFRSREVMLIVRHFSTDFIAVRRYGAPVFGHLDDETGPVTPPGR